MSEEYITIANFDDIEELDTEIPRLVEIEGIVGSVSFESQTYEGSGINTGRELWEEVHGAGCVEGYFYADNSTVRLKIEGRLPIGDQNGENNDLYLMLQTSRDARVPVVLKGQVMDTARLLIHEANLNLLSEDFKYRTLHAPKE